MSSGPAADPAVGTAHLRALGTSADLLVTDPSGTDRACAILGEELDAIDRACSRFRSDSELWRVNHARGRAMCVSALLAEAVAVALAAADVTDGDVDPTCGGSLVRIGRPTLPSRAAGEGRSTPSPPCFPLSRAGELADTPTGLLSWRAARCAPSPPMHAGTTNAGRATVWAALRSSRSRKMRNKTGTGHEPPIASQSDRLQRPRSLRRALAGDHRPGPVGLPHLALCHGPASASHARGGPSPPARPWRSCSRRHRTGAPDCRLITVTAYGASGAATGADGRDRRGRHPHGTGHDHGHRELPPDERHLGVGGGPADHIG
jgi:ApbE family protein